MKVESRSFGGDLMGKIKEDDLFFFYFGVELNAGEEEKKKVCIRKGYQNIL